MTVQLAVVGLGYVGLPLAREAAAVGLSVVGHDLDPVVVDALNSGRSHVDDVSDADLRHMLAAGFTATTGQACLGEAQTVVICVPTPLSADGGPDLTAVTGAVGAVAARLRPGVLVVLESTTYPGTTDEVVRPILEEGSGLRAGTDFALAFSPERIDPGNHTHSLRDTPKIVGGHTPGCAARAVAFYGKLVDTVVRAKGTREAEMAKLLENTYRHVNIALVNELAVLCRELGVDIWNAIDCAATKPFGFQAFRPGAGVGGHCIPIDPNYLSYKVRTLGYEFRFVELAREINHRMPEYVVRRAQDLLNTAGKALHGSRVLLLGVTYKPDVADRRESPAVPVARLLRRLGTGISFHDPFVDVWEVDGEPVTRAGDLAAALREYDLTILLQDHSVYDLQMVADRARLLFDTRGRIFRPDVEVL
ncbi:nucleotide sugar dehydrogenase [Actinacidiphila glaucinigra]|uniref:nucleotide sugar dehydrogenase n=1 Tax=Actinacidiphila glaucinigra TaxID=235986 RepID=UPI003869E7FD